MTCELRHNATLSRRDLLKLGGTVTLGSLAAPHLLAAELGAEPGEIVGESTGEKVGRRILEDGGNAVDAHAAASPSSPSAARAVA